MELETLIDACLNMVGEEAVQDACGCHDCFKIDRKKTCENCGWSGEFDTLSCGCYDASCRPGYNGAGCPHGSLVCPYCNDGDDDGWEAIKGIRARFNHWKRCREWDRQREEKRKHESETTCKGVGSPDGPWCDECADQMA